MNRYLNSTDIPQPKRKIRPSFSDILHVLKMGERLDNLANTYYGDPTMSWVIMCANVQYDNEFEIPIGTTIRVPYPLSRVLSSWQLTQSI